VSGWSLQRRIAATLAALGVVVALVVAVAAWSFLGMRSHQHEVIDDYYEAVTTSNEQFVALVDAETAVRGYALTGDPASLAPIEAAQARAGNDAARLQELLMEDEQALAALNQASATALVWWQDWAEPTIAEVAESGPAGVTEADIARGTRMFDQLRADYATYIDTVSDRRTEEVEVLDRRTAGLFSAVVAVAAVALVAMALLWWLLRRWVTRPLTVLADETRIVRDGALDHQVAVEGPPEVVRLSRDVDDMRRGLVDQIAAARTAGDELGAAKSALELQAADLERSNRELEQFAYVASHDLQEPLRKVASFTQLLQRRYSGQLDERADQYIEFAVDGAKRMQQLINDLLQFSRVGRMTTPQTDVDLDACLDRALRDVEARLEESGGTVTRDPLPVIRGEGPLLTQVLVNLLGNALKFRSQEPPRIHVGAHRDGDVWRVSVRDNGIGIEPQYAERVFVLFQRLHSKEAYAGTGIGLALARKIVEYHGGTIWIAEPHDGPGTTVELTLPAVDAEAPQDALLAPPVAAGAVPGSGGPDGT
jgi:signal transduction histidine kinase